MVEGTDIQKNFEIPTVTEIQEGLIFTKHNVRGAAITLKGFAVLTFAIGAFGFISPVWNWWTAAVREPGHVANIVFGCLMGVLFVVFASHIWRYSGLFIWKMDPEGIAFQGPHDDRRYLLWRDIERVRWNHLGVRLLGRGERIELNWNQLEPERQPDAARALLHFLGRDFCLPTFGDDRQKCSSTLSTYAKMTVYVLWFCASVFISKYMTLRLVSALLPALAPFAGLVIDDKPVLTYVCIAFFFAIYIGLISPFLILERKRVWFDRQLS